MAIQDQMLKVLAKQEEAVTAKDIATALEIKENATRTYLGRLKAKGLIEGDGDDGWKIVEAGKAILEKGEELVVTAADVGSDARSMLHRYGTLAGVPPNTIAGFLDLAMSQDPYDLERVINAMAQMDVPMPERRKWINLWRNFVIRNAPEEMKAKALAMPVEVDGGAATTAQKVQELGWILDGDEPIQVGGSTGTLTREEAVSLAKIRALKGSRGSGWVDEFDKFLSLMQRVSGGEKPTYVVAEDEDGKKILQEIPHGQPIVLPAASGKGKAFAFNWQTDEWDEIDPLKPPPLPHGPPATKQWIIHEDTGQVEEWEPGKPIVVTRLVKDDEKRRVLWYNPATRKLEDIDLSLPFIPPEDNTRDRLLVPWPGDEGKDIKVVLDDRITWERFIGDEKRKDEMHSVLAMVLNKAQEAIPKVTRILDRWAGSKFGGGGLGVVEVECPDCHQHVKVMPGTEQVLCTAPGCDCIFAIDWVRGGAQRLEEQAVEAPAEQPAPPAPPAEQPAPPPPPAEQPAPPPPPAEQEEVRVDSSPPSPTMNHQPSTINFYEEQAL